MTPGIQALVASLARQCIQHGWKLATAESCTGGGLAYAITSIPGSSVWFERGFVTYSDAAKQELLGVNPQTLAQFGAVSKEVAIEMAEGVLKHAQAQVSAAITGIAGPDGGSKEKPVGTVWFAWSAQGKETKTLLVHFQGNRQEIREQAIETALLKIPL